MATEFKLPDVGEGIESGTVVSVLVNVGDRVELEQPVLELETDKAVVEVPSTVAGVVESVGVKPNEEARIGQVIMTVAEGEAGATEADAPVEAAPTPGPRTEDGAEESGSAREAPRPEAERAERHATPEAPSEGNGGGLIPAAPSVRRLARELGVDLDAVRGSGILGRISAEDVRAQAEGRVPAGAAAPGPAAPQAPPLPDFERWGAVERVPMSGIRKATVRSMSTAWGTVPMVTHFDEARAGDFEALRQRHKARAEARGAKLTPTALLLKIVAAALRRFPDFNASLDVAQEQVVYKDYVHVGVAVDTEHGLLVPVLRDVDRKNVMQLAEELGTLAEKARDRKLAPEDMQGANFSVSNLGGIGGTGFTPIVSPPEVAILGVSRNRHQPVYDPDSGTFQPQLIMPLSVTYDHRLIDGAKAARFLRWVCDAVEDPFLVSLEG